MHFAELLLLWYKKIDEKNWQHTKCIDYLDVLIDEIKRLTKTYSRVTMITYIFGDELLDVCWY